MSIPYDQRGSLNFLAGGGEMGERIRSFDWASTSLGPPDGWPQSLKTSIRIMLMSRQPVWIGWGSDLIYFYNDPYFSIIGGKHPWALGRPTREVWREIWDVIGPMLATAMGGDEGTYVESQRLIMERNGYPEETYYTFSYSPIPDDEGLPGGIFCANSDDTQRVIGQRELALLRDLASRTAKSKSIDEVTERSIAALKTNPWDIPFAALFLVREDETEAYLARATQIEAGHPLAPETVPLDNDYFRFDRVLREQSHQIVDIEAYSAGLPVGPWQHASSRAIVLPLPAAGDTTRGGLLVAGLSPYRFISESYLGFMNLVAGQIAAALSDAEAIERDRKRLEAMAELDRAKTAFFANVSHEFRTPLTLMLGPLQDLISQDLGQLPTRVQLELETIRRNGVRLQKLVNALLDFSRLEAGRLRAKFSPTDFGAFTAEMASSFSSAIQRADLKYVVDCPALGPAERAYVDRDLWEKVVLNLISNAFKHTFEGAIRVSTRQSPNSFELTVADSGIGISPQDLEHLFERFRRVEGARARSHEGSGIGLALVHEIVKLHGGRISVSSQTEGPRRGTTFTVSIPRGSGHLPSDQVFEIPDPVEFRVNSEAIQSISDLIDPADPDVGTPSHPLTVVPLRSSGARVLIADDNADMRGYISRLLGANFRVELVPDGQAALDTIRACPFDLVITDVMMPRMDGFALLRAIRSDPKTSELPVIMLSARAGEESRIEGLEAGADDYLVKPFSARELLARVDSTLSLARLRTEAQNSLRESADQLQIALSEREDAEALLAAEKRILEMVTTGFSVQEVLDELSSSSETLSKDGMLCSILLLSDEGTQLLHGAAPSLPRDYSEAIHGIRIGPSVGSCGTAAYRREFVSVSDISTDPLWSDFKDLALKHGLRSCTSRPIMSSKGELLGTIAMYYRVPKSPAIRDLELTDRTARLAAIVIERDRALGAAEAERMRLRDLFTQAPALICVLKGPHHVFTLANPIYLAAVGRASEQELIGKPVREALPEVEGQGFFEILDRVYETGEPYFGLESFIRLDSTGSGVLEDRYLNFVYQPSRNAEGQVDGILLHAVDVSDQVYARRSAERMALELEDKVRERTVELTEANEQLQGFTYSVAHDLRQQIRRISTNASMILHDEEDHLNPESRAKLKRMVGGAHQLSELVDDLLGYARNHIASIHPENIDLSSLANEIAEILLESGQYLISPKMIVHPTPMVFADRSMTRIVLENLIENAFKYSRDIDSPFVEFGFADGAYFVRDNGIGFDMRYVHKLFLPFERLHSDSSISGTGIGLANVRRLIDRHKGKIWAEGDPDKGSTFWFTLPHPQP